MKTSVDQVVRPARPWRCVVSIDILDATICLRHQPLSLGKAGALDLTLFDHLKGVHNGTPQCPRPRCLARIELHTTEVVSTVTLSLP